MAKNLDNYAKEKLVADLICGKVNVNEINVSKQAQREAFKEALKSNPNILKKVKDSNAEQLIGFAIKEDYKYFLYINLDKYFGGLYIDKDQNAEDWAQYYLFKRLESDAKERELARDKNDNLSSMVMQKSLDGKIVFYYNYITPKNEEIHFYDTSLQIPLSLKTSFKVKLKVKGALELIKKLDVEVGQVGENRVFTTIEDVLTSQFNDFLSEYISKNNAGYYQLCSALVLIEKEYKNKLNTELLKYGIEAIDVTIKKFAIPQEVLNKIEDQAFLIRQRRADVEADSEFAKKSMSLYAEKLALQDKYPNSEHSLTEYEKDMALKRYLIKNNKLKEEEIDRSIEMKQPANKKDVAIEKIKDVIPTVTKRRNKFSLGYWWTFICALVLSFWILGSNTGVGLIILGLSVGIWGAIGAVCYKKFKTQDEDVNVGGEEDDGSEE